MFVLRNDLIFKKFESYSFIPIIDYEIRFLNVTVWSNFNELFLYSNQIEMTVCEAVLKFYFVLGNYSIIYHTLNIFFIMTIA